VVDYRTQRCGTGSTCTWRRGRGPP